MRASAAPPRGATAGGVHGPDLPADYDRSLLREGMTGLHLSPLDRRLLRDLERAWGALHPARTRPDAELRIPRILHQIWLGPKPMPERFRRFRDRWIELHPGWEHRLWTDREVAELDFEERDLYEAADNTGMQSDILRAVVVGRYGGVYADVDYECLRPLDLFHRLYDFYGTLRPGLAAHTAFPTIFPSPLLVCISLFGAVPGHPVPAQYLGKVRRLWRRKDEIRLGPDRFAARLAGGDLEAIRRANVTMKLTYLPFGSTVARHMARPDRDDRALVLPPSYFNPLDTWWGKGRFASPVFWYGLLKHAARGGRGIPPHYVEVPSHAFAVHHSRASWL